MPSNATFMHKEILTKEQIKLLPIVKSFSKDFGLVGGTAIALYIGHRESIDFDLFTLKDFENYKIRKKLRRLGKIGRVIKDELDNYTLIIDSVQFTFFHYPFKINFSENCEGIKLPNLLTLAAMKAYALGRRAKWKDYVDLYFIIKKYHSIEKINQAAKKIFGNEFNEKIFRMQITYFKDISYQEKITFHKGFETSDEKIKKELMEFSLI